MPDLPERVWLTPGLHGDGQWYGAENTITELGCYVPESRALAAEAEVKALASEVERLKIEAEVRTEFDAMREDRDAFQAEVERLTKEREEIFRALHPECWAHPGIPNSCTVEMCDCFDSHELAQQVAQLRADLRALAEFARATVKIREICHGKRKEEDAARAVLASLDREGT